MEKVLVVKVNVDLEHKIKLLKLLSEGKTYQEISGICYRSRHAVKNDVHDLKKHFNVKSLHHLIAKAKDWLLICAFLFFSNFCKAQYLAGGNMLYEYIGPSWCASFGCPYQAYRITLKLILTDSSQFAPTARMFVWNNDNGILWYARDEPLDAIVKLREHRDPCVLGDSLQYWCGYYKLTVDLAPNSTGYICSYQQGL